MTYNETIEYLYNAAPAFEKVGASAYKEGLSNTEALDEHANHPHRKYMTIHVAGTNGKGSCSHTLAAILQLAGLKVGLYTSPHLVTFRERIRVNGEMVPEERVVSWVEENRQFFEPLHPSFFELTTALAFQYFAEQEVDIAVIEVGLGGRLDCTNIIRPVLSVITNISFDHTQFLGDTLEKIAGEKAGIIKEGVPVIIGETTPETRPVFERVAQERHAPIIFAEEHPVKLDCDYELKGSYQEKNRQTVLNCLVPLARALKEHGHEISDATQTVRKAFEHVCSLTGLQGRWQTLSDPLSPTPLVICDTGHNVAGWEYLAPQIASTFAAQLSKHSDATLRIVFGMVDDKDIDKVFSLMRKHLKPYLDSHKVEFYFCQASTHRAIPSTSVAEKAASALQTGCSDPTKSYAYETASQIGRSYPTVPSAYKSALSASTTHDFIFIGGSSYVVADLLESLKQDKNL